MENVCQLKNFVDAESKQKTQNSSKSNNRVL